MSNIVIKIENLSKQYRLGLVSTGTISHDINRWWCNMVGKEDPYLKIGESNDRTSKGESDYVWALKDINFEVKRGDRIGIIGKNGAGKSTLLKILSLVTGPTTGSIKMKGRIGALLEVGTGFHPELTGRENIYMNGTILGMKRWEVKAKLDEIVDFAGVERYLDTPVKRYSSGMMVRLGFAVAAHLEPDILIVDEVLAVGDAEFQKKAIGKMKEISEGHGRTILFVSHNMTAIKNLCDSAIFLKNGYVKESGKAFDIINKYLDDEVVNLEENCLRNRTDRKGLGRFKFVKTWIEKDNGEKPKFISTGENLNILIQYEIDCHSESIQPLQIAMGLNSMMGISVSDLSNTWTNQLIKENIPKNGIIKCSLKNVMLNTGKYTYNLMARSIAVEVEDYIVKAGSFNVEADDYYRTGKAPSVDRILLMDQDWSIIK